MEDSEVSQLEKKRNSKPVDHPITNSSVLATDGIDVGKGVLSDSEKIELLSEDVQEIMGHVPPWLVRWGITAFLIILTGVIIGSCIFKYPDVITSSVVILSENPPAYIVAHSTGKIDNLLVKNGQLIKQGDILAIIENTADYHHVRSLKSKLNLLEKSFSDNQFDPSGIDFDETYILGSIQQAYSGFVIQFKEYSDYLQLGIPDKKIVSVQKQISDYGKYCERIKIQLANYGKTVTLNYKQFRRDSTLFVSSVIAEADYEKSEQTYLSVKNSYQSLLASLNSTQMQINQLEYQVIDLQSQKTEQVQKYVNSIRESVNTLKYSISEWEKSYALVSPIEGKVTFTNFWSSNQFVTAGQQVFTVVPSKPLQIIGRLKFPVTGAGKVAIGQKVLIQIENYPHTEFGMIDAKIASISLIPESTKDGVFYTSQVMLVNGLTTNYKKKLPFNQEMQGTAQIITKNLTLFDRLISPMKSALKKSI